MEPNDFYWLVGILEGEGAFIATRPKPKQPSQERVTMASTDLDVVERVARLFGGTSVRVNRSRNRLGKKVCYITSLNSLRARTMMELLLPEMSARRREQIRRALAARPQGALAFTVPVNILPSDAAVTH